MIHKISKFKIKTALVLLIFSFASGSNMVQLVFRVYLLTSCLQVQ